MKNQPGTMKEYVLSGDAVVRVFQPFGKEKYVAIVEQNGRYPAPGKIAKNKGRCEFSVVLSGTFEFTVDGKKMELQSKDFITVADGQSYSIEGQGSVLVFVDDQEDGATLIENSSE